jgi:hypothetical protein
MIVNLLRTYFPTRMSSSEKTSQAHSSHSPSGTHLSISRLTTSSQDYEFKLKGLKSLENTPKLMSSPNPSETPNITISQDPLAANDIEAALLKSTGTHMKYQFQEGSANFFCKIFYAEQFDALRINCGCDERYIQSLSRCVKWDSSGGKSKSAFLKTLGPQTLRTWADSRRPPGGEANVAVRNGRVCKICACIL